MDNNILEIKTALKVLKPPHSVFEAIVDPAKMSQYFISKSTGRMEENKTLVWWFPEFTDEIPVKVNKIEKDKFISFSWNDGADKKEMFVEITLSSSNNEQTLVTVTEKQRQNDAAGIKWLKSNTEGWANFLACLKAYLEYGINLRKGAFDFLNKHAS